MKPRNSLQLAAAGGLITSVAMFSSLSQAALTNYYNDFETSTGDFASDGWVNFIDNGFGTYGFPLDGGQTQGTTLASGQGGAAQGSNHLNVFSNYDDGAHAVNTVEYNVFQQQTTSVSDIGSTWTFSFDAKANNDASTSPGGTPAIDPGSGATAGAFVKGFGPGFSFFFPIYNEDMTTLSATDWTNFSVDITLNAVNPGDWDNWIIQFGFTNSATNYADTGVLYDNISFSQVSAVPVPAAAWLFGSALAGLAAYRRKTQ